MADEYDFGPVGKKLDGRIAWEQKRARGQRSDNEKPISYEPIVFPECPGLCHAARVVAGRMAAAEPDLLDAIDATREVLEALGIISIMENGGDGRALKIQRRSLDDTEPRPLGYDEQDVGRSIRKTRKKPDAPLS